MSAQETYDNYSGVVNSFETAVLRYVEYQRLTPYNIVRDFGDDILASTSGLSDETVDQLRSILYSISRDGQGLPSDINAETVLRGLEIDDDLLVKIFGANEEMYRGNVVYTGNRLGFNEIADDIMDRFSQGGSFDEQTMAMRLGGGGGLRFSYVG